MTSRRINTTSQGISLPSADSPSSRVLSFHGQGAAVIASTPSGKPAAGLRVATVTCTPIRFRKATSSARSAASPVTTAFRPR